MSIQYDDCLKKGRIKPFSRGKALAGKELETAESDHESGMKSLSQKNYKWATIQAYYSMFHTARALLYARNLKEHSHTCLILAIEKLYVNNGKIREEHIESLREAKGLREDADYYSRWSKESSEKLLKSAEAFIKESRKLL